jgi:hypothetical protein
MSDESARKLARAVAGGGAAAERVRLALELERAGRRDEAYETLLPGLEEPIVRREIARFPAWAHDRATAGRTGCLDVAPITCAPRVKWTRPVSKMMPSVAGMTRLLASPLGIVCAQNDGFVVLGAETGRLRWERRWSQPQRFDDELNGGVPNGPDVNWIPQLAISGESLLCWNAGTLTSYDLWTGETFYEYNVGRGDLALLSDRLLIFGLNGRNVAAWEISDPRKPPSRAWQSSATSGAHMLSQSVASTDNLVLVSEAIGRLAALDRRTGSVRWTGSAFLGAIADDASCLTWSMSMSADPANPGPRYDVTCFDPTGVRVWDAGDNYLPAALGSHAVVRAKFAQGSMVNSSVTLLDRVRGAGAIPVRGSQGLLVWSTSAIARDVVVVPSGNIIEGVSLLAARERTGEVLWVFDPKDLPVDDGSRVDRPLRRNLSLGAVAVLPRRVLFVLDGALVCLEPTKGN